MALTANRVALLFVLILALGIVMRFAGLDTAPPGLYADEAFYGIDAMDSLANHDFRVFYSANFGREGMFIDLIAASFATFGDSVATLRGVSAAVGSLTLVFIYLLTMEWFRPHPARRQIALLAMFLAAVSFWHLNFSRVAFHGILVPLIQSAGLYLLLRAIRAGSVIWCVAAGIVLGAGIYSSKAFPAIGPLILLILWRALKDRKLSYPHVAVVCVSALLVTVPMLLYVIQAPGAFFLRSNEVGLWNIRPGSSSLLGALLGLADLLKNTVLMLLMPFVAGDRNWRHNFRPFPELSLLAMAGVIFAIYIYHQNTRHNAISTGATQENTDRFRLLVLYAVSAALPAIVTNEGIPHSSRAIGMIVPLHLLAASGLYEMYDRLRESFGASLRAWRSAACLLLAGTAIATNLAYFAFWKYRPETRKAFAFETRDLKDYELHKYGFLKPYLGDPRP